MNFVRLYIGDYLRDTGTLTLAQHGAYFLMMLELCATEKAIPSGRALHRLLRADSNAEKQAINAVAERFWRAADGGIVNARCLEEIERASKQRSVNQENSLRGGRPRKTESVSESVSESKPNPKPNGNPNQTPDTIKSKEQKQEQVRSPPCGSRLPPDFPAASDLNWARAKRPALDAAAEAECFRDYWTAKAGKDGRKLDWPATWRNWIRNARAVPTARAGPFPKSKTAAAYDAIGETIASLNRQPAADLVHLGHSFGDSKPDPAEPGRAAGNGSDRSGDHDLGQRPLARSAVGTG